jgi:hypothetical protein
LAVASTFGFSCFGFFASLFPRLLLPFPITTSKVDHRSGDMPERSSGKSRLTDLRQG